MREAAERPPMADTVTTGPWTGRTFTSPDQAPPRWDRNSFTRRRPRAPNEINIKRRFSRITHGQMSAHLYVTSLNVLLSRSATGLTSLRCQGAAAWIDDEARTRFRGRLPRRADRLGMVVRVRGVNTARKLTPSFRAGSCVWVGVSTVEDGLIEGYQPAPVVMVNEAGAYNGTSPLH